MEQQIAFVAYYFHWTLQDIEQLSHVDREHYIEEISRINKLITKEEGGMFDR